MSLFLLELSGHPHQVKLFSCVLIALVIAFKNHVFICICVNSLSVYIWLPHPIFNIPLFPQPQPFRSATSSSHRISCLLSLLWWLHISGGSCPGWHELMITAQASQTRHMHYITQAGLQQICSVFDTYCTVQCSTFHGWPFLTSVSLSGAHNIWLSG